MPHQKTKEQRYQIRQKGTKCNLQRKKSKKKHFFYLKTDFRYKKYEGVL